MYLSSYPLMMTPSTPPLVPVAPCTTASSSVKARFGSRLAVPSNPIVVVTTEFTPVDGVPSYVSRLAIPTTSSPVRVSYTKIDASV